MGFFKRGKAGKHERKKYVAGIKYQKPVGKKKLSGRTIPPSNEVEKVTSEEEDVSGAEDVDNLSLEEEMDTAQERKLQLAKVYLEEIEKEEQKRLQNGLNGDDSGTLVSQRLKVDHLQQIGKLKLSIANLYTGADISNIKVLSYKEHHNTITCMCLSYNNNFIFSGSKDGSVVKWSLQNYKVVANIPFIKKATEATSKEVFGHRKQIMCIAISSDDKYLVVGDMTNEIQVWNPDNLKHLGKLRGHRAAVTGVAVRKNTHTLYSCSKDRCVKVWALDEMAYIETLYGHQDGITAISTLLLERVVTSGGTDCSIRMWKIAEESQLIFNGHSGSIDTVRLINEENFISGGDDGQICIWSSMKKKPLCSMKEAHGLDQITAQPLWITAVTSLLNTDLVASGSSDGFIKLWKLGEGFRSIELLFNIKITGFINDLSFTADGKYLIAAVGIEHRLGRWTVINSAKKGIIVIPLLKL